MELKTMKDWLQYLKKDIIPNKKCSGNITISKLVNKNLLFPVYTSISVNTVSTYAEIYAIVLPHKDFAIQCSSRGYDKYEILVESKAIHFGYWTSSFRDFASINKGFYYFTTKEEAEKFSEDFKNSEKNKDLLKKQSIKRCGDSIKS